MTLDQWASLGEIIGAVGVIVSVIYLAIQVRKQTEESRLAATRELATQYQDGLKFIAADEKLSQIWLKGIKDYESLPDLERFRVSLVFHDVLRSIEQQYFHTKNRNVEGSFLESINHIFSEFLTFPGVRQWWQTSRHGFEKKFRDYIDAMVEESRTQSFTSTFSRANEDSA